jgi:hypothetical protein
MNPSQTEYRSYLVRLWRSSDKDPWRAMIEQVGSNEQLMFANLESLLDFLQSGQSESVVETALFLSGGDDAGSDDETNLHSFAPGNPLDAR